MTLALETVVELTEKVIAKARTSEEVVEMMGGEDSDIPLQEREVAYLSALARALRKSGINVRSMTAEVTCASQFSVIPGAGFTVPLYYLHYQGVDFASHGMCGEDSILQGLNNLVDLDHHGARLSGFGGSHDISRGEDADEQEDLHDWFDQNIGPFLANEQAQTISSKTATKPVAKKPRSRI